MAELPAPTLCLSRMGGIDVLTDEALFDAAGVRVAFTSRAGGVSDVPFASLNIAGHVGDDPECVERNRRIVAEALGFPQAPRVVPHQVHGTNVITVASPADAPRAQGLACEGADAVVVESPGVAALLNFADCLPLVLVSPSGRFAVVHAGWRGAVAGIAGKAARVLAEAASRAGCNAYIGPHIGPECFEVGPEVVEQFENAFGQDVVAGARHVSLAKAVEVDLVRSGFEVERIVNCGVCTKCRPKDYYSYRASNGQCGRHAAVAYRQP